MSRTPRPEQDPEFLSTLERGLRVLRAFNRERPDMSLSEMAAVTDLSPAVARRCLNTLAKLGYVAQTGRRFILRPEVLAFGSAYLASMNIEEVATPYLQAVRDQTGDLSSLAVLSGHDVLYLAHVSTTRRLRIGAAVGTRFPAHATSLGRVILAYLPDTEITRFLDEAPLPMLTEHTLTAKADLEDRLKAARANGYESAQDELDYGVVSVSAPVFDADRRVLAAINCSTSTTRVGREELVRTRVPLLKDAAEKIEGALRRWPFLAQSLRA